MLKAEYNWSFKQVSEREFMSEIKVVSSILQQKLLKLLNILGFFLSYKILSNENKRLSLEII